MVLGLRELLLIQSQYTEVKLEVRAVLVDGGRAHQVAFRFVPALVADHDVPEVRPRDVLEALAIEQR